MENNSTTRFSNRVDDYAKYRPHYPPEIINFLQECCALNPDMQVADIGAGTGISTAPFLRAGYRVFAVEPNKEMRAKAVDDLGHYPAFIAVEGTAEQTGLDDSSIDVIVVAQAFHWFDLDKTKTEFRRILKEEGQVVLLSNQRLIETAFEITYDTLIMKHANKYVDPEARFGLADVSGFYSPFVAMKQTFRNKQDFNFEGLKGRLLSSSYMPVAGAEGYEPMMEDLQKVFNKYQVNGLVRINYTTNLFAGRLK